MIKKIRVQNFKSLRDITVDLALTNVLVGPNMSGKSNFIDVFRFLTDLLVPAPGTHALANAFNKRNGFKEVAWKGGESDVMKFSISGAHQNTNEPVEWKYELELLGERRYGTVSVKHEQLVLLHHDQPSLLIKTEGQQRVLIGGVGAMTQIQDSNRLALEFEIPNWEGNEIRSQIVSWRFYHLVPTLMRQANPSVVAPVLTEPGDNLGSWLLLLQTRYGEEFNRIVNACREALPGLENVLAWPTQQSTVYIASREKYLASPTTVWQMSDGELSFIALLSLIFAPKELGAPLYCIEEPENNLHPKLLSILTGLLKQVQEELGVCDAGQVIVSTHSPQLIDQCSIEDLILFHRTEGMTHCTRPRDNEHFKKLVESGEIGLGDLYYSGALARA